jgi:stress-induced morphogen
MPTYNAEQLEAAIKAGLTSCDHVAAVDESDGCGSKFEITIVSR